MREDAPSLEGSCEVEAEDADGAVMALVLGLVDAGLASGHEPAFFHHAA